MLNVSNVNQGFTVQTKGWPTGQPVQQGPTVGTGAMSPQPVNQATTPTCKSQSQSIRLSCRSHKLVQSDITGWILLHLLIFNVAVIHRTHRTNISDCQPCPPGRYCQNRGATEVTGMCKAGHICYGLALYDDPVYNNDTSGNKTAILWGDTCHPGYYCPQGTSVMVACPRGTYNPDRSGTSEAASCKQCDPGKYCNGTALTEVTGQYLLCFIRVLL